MDKQFGKGSVLMLGSPSFRAGFSVISSGMISIDNILGSRRVSARTRRGDLWAGGFRKTTLALHVIAEAQRAERRGCVYRR